MTNIEPILGWMQMLLNRRSTASPALTSPIHKLLEGVWTCSDPHAYSYGSVQVTMTVCSGMKGLRQKHGSRCLVELIRVNVDDWVQRWTDESRQLCLRVKVTLEQVLTARTFVGKQIHLCKRSPFVPWHSLSLRVFHLSLSLSLSCLNSLGAPFYSLFTSLAPAWLIFMRNASCQWLQLLLPRREKLQTAALSAFSDHQPDCTAMGGYITAVSGQQQVPSPACQPRWAPTSPTGCPLALCLHVTLSPSLTHTAAATQASTHPPRQLYHPCRRGNCHTLSAEKTFCPDNIHTHLANTYVLCKNMHIKCSNASWL